MWKKTDIPQSSSNFISPKVAKKNTEKSAVIGVSIHIKGNIIGEEHLLIHGQVEGQIKLEGNDLTVGSQGRVKADIHAKVISVEGNVRGNLFGEEKIVIRNTGNVKGNLIAPRVSLEEGATFKGSIDMGTVTKKKPESQIKKGTQQTSPPKSTKSSSQNVTSTLKTTEMPLGRKQ